MLLVDLQDLGCRIYTFVTTLRYVLEAAARARQGGLGARPAEPGGPPGRGPDAAARLGELRRRRARCRCATGCTLGELGALVRAARSSSTSNTSVVAMEGWQPAQRPATAGRWASAPGSTRARTRPTCAMARCYAGTVMLEGTTLSEGRGTTRPLELFGAPDIDAAALLAKMHALAPALARGLPAARLLVRADLPQARGQALRRRADPRRRSRLRPLRVPAVAADGARVQGAARARARLRAVARFRRTNTRPTRLAIDLINGGPVLREWVDDPAATPGDLDELARATRTAWQSKE